MYGFMDECIVLYLTTGGINSTLPEVGYNKRTCAIRNWKPARMLVICVESLALNERVST